MSVQPTKFVSRAGMKLQGALSAFGVDVHGMICADFGCNVGGFTDCLLQRGAAKVYAIDTGYGELAWKLRKDSRVIVMERTNVLYCDLPEPMDLVTIDAAWTPQELIVPAAMRRVKPGGRIISLLKPHYELEKFTGSKPRAPLADAQADDVCRAVCERLVKRDCLILAAMRSGIRGKGGNVEFVLLLASPRADR